MRFLESLDLVFAACAYNEVDYNGESIATHDYISNWKTCYAICESVPECGAWVLNLPDHSDVNGRYKCFLKKKGGTFFQKSGSKIVSGKMNCVRGRWPSIFSSLLSRKFILLH